MFYNFYKLVIYKNHDDYGNILGVFENFGSSLILSNSANFGYLVVLPNFNNLENSIVQ